MHSQEKEFLGCGFPYQRFLSGLSRLLWHTQRGVGILIFLHESLGHLYFEIIFQHHLGPPNFREIPPSSFSCEGRTAGYYADPEARCQVFIVVLVSVKSLPKGCWMVDLGWWEKEWRFDPWLGFWMGGRISLWLLLLTIVLTRSPKCWPRLVFRVKLISFWRSGSWRFWLHV